MERQQTKYNLDRTAKNVIKEMLYYYTCDYGSKQKLLK